MAYLASRFYSQMLKYIKKKKKYNIYKEKHVKQGVVEFLYNNSK